ncbi:MAG TPA: QueT transporter family protein [Candidatus Binataceae bacterium]|jgi:energy-coupling factor transport system substrate-specific component|nr:QueT transporter family protein [Candidatus Binataceae bacterium]
MRELRSMWSNTRMVVLSAISAALYAAVLVPFKVVPFIPGVTELRPANAIPVVCSFLFGPAAAWGAAIGNMIGDFFGGAGPNDIFGFFANIVYGYVPYKVWQVLAKGEEPVIRSPVVAVKFVIACLLASTFCADIVGWGENLLALKPFLMMGNAIVLNDMLAAMLLSPFLLGAIYPRVKAGHLLYEDVMPELQKSSRWTAPVGLILLIIGVAGAWVTGNLISTGYWTPHALPASMTQAPYDRAIGIVVTPLLALAALGLGLM